MIYDNNSNNELNHHGQLENKSGYLFLEMTTLQGFHNSDCIYNTCVCVGVQVLCVCICVHISIKN